MMQRVRLIANQVAGTAGDDAKAKGIAGMADLNRNMERDPNSRSSKNAVQPQDGKPYFMHTMLRIYDAEKSIKFFETLGLKVISRTDSKAGKFTLYFMASEVGEPEIELTHNWEDAPTPTQLGEGPEPRNFGHLAFGVDNIYETCEKMEAIGVKILRPPHDGRMAFVRSPDQISLELIQKGKRLPDSQKWKNAPTTPPW